LQQPSARQQRCAVEAISGTRIPVSARSCALTEAGIRVVFVTHLYDLARRWYTGGDAATLFLRAERLADGRRTFRLIAGEPLPTSYGQDLYREIFDTAYEAASA
jgi:hypothetical protein